MSDLDRIFLAFAKKYYNRFHYKLVLHADGSGYVLRSGYGRNPEEILGWDNLQEGVNKIIRHEFH